MVIISQRMPSSRFSALNHRSLLMLLYTKITYRLGPPLVCSQCGREFKKLGWYRKHLERVHSLPKPPDTTQIPPEFKLAMRSMKKKTLPSVAATCCGEFGMQCGLSQGLGTSEFCYSVTICVVFWHVTIRCAFRLSV